MTRPTTYLVRVLLFLLAVGAVTALLSSTLYQAFCNNPWLDGLIVGILLLGIGWNISMILRLIPEVRWVNILRHPREGLTAPRRRACWPPWHPCWPPTIRAVG